MHVKTHNSIALQLSMTISKTFISINKYIETWAIFCLVIFILGYFFFPSSSKQNTFYYLGVCVPIVLLLPKYYRQLKPQTWLTFSVLFLAFYLFLNSLWSIHFSLPQSFKYLRHLFTIYCLFAAIFLLLHKYPNCSRLLFNAFIVIGFFDSIIGIVDHFYLYKAPLLTRYADPIDSAMLVGLPLLACFWLIAENISWKKRFIYLFLAIPFIVIMLLSKSRGPQIALLLTLPLIPYFHAHSLKTFIFTFLVLLLFTCLFLLFSDTYKLIFDRGLSFPYRMEIWLVSLKESFNYFWFGQGASYKALLSISSGEKFEHSHNILLTIFRMGGIVGVMLFSINLALSLLAGFKQSKSIEKTWLIWLFFGILCLMTNGRYPLTRPNASWLVYWIPIAFICASNSKFLPIKHS